MIIATHGIVASQIVLVPVATAATSVTDTSFVANWNAYTGAVYYLLDVSTSSSFSSYVLQDLPVYTNSYTVTGLSSNTTYYYRVRASTEYDTNYTAILNYATTQGYTLPSTPQRVKQNQLILDLKYYGIWSKLDSFAVFATNGNSNFALIDWKRLSQLTAVNSPTFTSNQGFTGNGSSSYINTNFNPNSNGVNLTLNSTSFGFYYRVGSSAVAVGSGNYIAGNSNGLYINPLTGASAPYLMRSWNNSTSGLNAGTVTDRVGLFHTDRNNSSNIYHIKDGVELANPTLSSNTRPNANLYLLAALYSGNAVEFGTEQISMYFAGGSLYSEKANFNTAWTTYLNSL